MRQASESVFWRITSFSARRWRHKLSRESGAASAGKARPKMLESRRQILAAKTVAEGMRK